MIAVLIIVGVFLLVITVVFLYLAIASADESRWKDRNNDRRDID